MRPALVAVLAALPFATRAQQFDYNAKLPLRVQWLPVAPEHEPPVGDLLLGDWKCSNARFVPTPAALTMKALDP